MDLRFLFLLALSLCFCRYARPQNGSINGTVTDAKNRETLIGATVAVQGTNKGTITDFDGHFIIGKLSKGSYNLIISYISYDTRIIRVEVTDEADQTVDIELQPATLDIGEVKVVARRREDTELSMMAGLKAGNLIVSGITAQQIQKSQDKDAAEVIRRVPGITITDDRFVVVRGLIERYNSVMLNGTTAPSFEADKRAFSFDAIPSGMISNILIYKSPAPELPADFAGAAINIETKNVADENSLVISYGTKYVANTTFSPGFQTYEGGKTDWLGFSGHSRDIPDGIPTKEEFSDLYVWKDAASYLEKTEKLNNISKLFNNNWSTSPETPIPDQALSLTLQRRFVAGKLSIGNITAFNYNLNYDRLNLNRLEYQDYSAEQDLVVKDFDFLDKRYKQSAKIGLIHNWNFIFRNNQKIEFRNFLNQMGNKTTTIRDGVNYYNVETVRLYDLKFESRFVYSGQLAGEHRFNNERTRFNWMAGYGYTRNDQPDNRRLTYVLNEDPLSDRYNQYYLRLQNVPNAYLGGRLWLDMVENLINLKADFEHNFQLTELNGPLTLKGGVFYERKNRRFDSRLIGLVATGNPPDIFYNDIDEILSSENFYFDQTAPYNQHGLSYRDNTRAKDSYKAHDLLMAGYLGLKIPFSKKVNLYGGLRIENFDRAITDFYEKTDDAENLDILVDTINIYPSANLTWNLNEQNLLRASYGKTINRPEFREMSNFDYQDFDRFVLIHGNENLFPAYIDNFDLRYEWYPSNGEIVSLAAFYKNFTHPIEVFLIKAGTGYDYRPYNTEQGYSMGLELDIRKQFYEFENSDSFLRMLKYLTLVFNTSWIKSEINTEKQGFARETRRIMQGQSPYIINLGLSYHNPDAQWMMALNYNRIGKRIAYVGTPDNPHTWELPRNSLDLTLEKGLGKRFSLKAGIKDILNNPVRYVQYYGPEEQFEMDTHRVVPNRNISISVIYKI